jgi:hypothetical protein
VKNLIRLKIKNRFAFINFFLLSVMLLIVITFVNKLMTVSYLINATA